MFLRLFLFTMLRIKAVAEFSERLENDSLRRRLGNENTGFFCIFYEAHPYL